MPGKPINIGPFTGGLNNISISGEAADDELVQLINFEVDKDTSLTSRPPIELVEGTTLPSTNTLGWEILGIFRVNTTTWYLIVVVPTSGSTNVDTTVKAYLNGVIGAGESVTIIKNSTGIANKVTAMVQFKERLYFAVGPDASDTGFSWALGEATGGVAITSMPRGTTMIGWQSRLWISGVTKLGTNATEFNRVYFSTINSSGPQPGTWEASNFFDTAPGEGGFITCLLASFNNLIIFKTDGAWRFSFAATPANGKVEKISGQVGAANKFAAVEFENFIFVYDQGIVYELINSNFTQVNRFVKFSENPFSVDNTAPGVELSIVNRRLIVRYFNNLYVYTVDTKSWSQWFSYNGTPGRFVELPTDSASSTPRRYVAATMGSQTSLASNAIIDPNYIDPVINKNRLNVLGGTAVLEVLSGINSFRIGKSSGTTEVVMNLNRTGTDTEFDIPMSVGQRFELKATVHDNFGTGNKGFRVTYFKTNGATEVVDNLVTAIGAVTFTLTVPAGVILARVAAFDTSTVDNARLWFYGVSFNRIAAQSPLSILRLMDEYPANSGAIEFIDCWMETKGYDYQASLAFKRLFYWGVDMRTTRAFLAEARPVSKRIPVSWGDLQAYTWGQLEQGTWGNPLSWLNKTTTIYDYVPSQENISDNGRFFAKILKALRFRQISFYLRLSTLGTSQTGPVKIFSLTTMIVPKQDVVDKVS